jgi:hypothetical protein
MLVGSCMGKRHWYPLARGWMGPRAGLDAMEKKKTPACARNQTLAFQPIACYCTDSCLRSCNLYRYTGQIVDVKPCVQVWQSSSISIRREEMLLTCLRLGMHWHLLCDQAPGFTHCVCPLRCYTSCRNNHAVMNAKPSMFIMCCVMIIVMCNVAFLHHSVCVEKPV